jgi:hypothetical protein
MSLHADNRARLAARLRDDGAPAGAVVLLQGGAATTRHETDHEDLFRQESSFHWAFGVREPDCYGAIEVASGRATLFVPRLPDAYRVWMGEIKTPAAFAATYAMDAVRYVDELPEVLAGLVGTSPSPSPLLLLKGLNSDSKAYATPGACAWLCVSVFGAAAATAAVCRGRQGVWVGMASPRRGRRAHAAYTLALSSTPVTHFASAPSPAATFPGIDKFATDATTRLWDALVECRVIKTPKELEARTRTLIPCY